jgi:hypothetical protein
MAGKKGRSGGYRPPRKPPLNVPRTADPLEFLLAIAACPEASPTLRVRAATSALPYVHLVQRRRSKKDTQQEAAARALRGFGPKRAPRLVGLK